MPLKRMFRFNQRPTQVLSLRVALWLLGGEILLGVLGYIWLEGYHPAEAFYMVIITISTVGFTEVSPLSLTGRMFTSALILVNIGIFAYLLAVFSYYVIEGEFFKSLYLNRMRKQIDALNNHVILCGFGKYGKEIAFNLRIHHTPFVVVDQDAEKIERLQHSDFPYLCIEGDATHDEVLLSAGISRARAVITALADDSDNLFIVITARQLNPRLNIISRAMELKSEKKLLKAGANHVVMPEQIGGFYMATLVSKPGAVEFFSFITNEYQSDIGFEELRYADLPPDCQNVPIRDLHLRKRTGVNIIGYRDSKGEYHVNPSPDELLSPGASFIVLGSAEQLARLRQLLQDGYTPF